MPVPREEDKEHDRLHPARCRQRDRHPDMREELHQSQCQQQIGRDRHGRHLDRGRGVLAGEEAGCQHLDQHESRQPNRIGGQRRGGRRRLDRPERTTLEQHRQDRLRQYDECRRRGQRQQQGQLDAAVLRRHRAGLVAGAHLARQRWQDSRRNGDADDPERQLVQPVCVVQIGHRAARQQRGERGRDHQIELRDPGAQHPRPHDPQRLLDARRQPRQARPQRHPGAGAGRHQPKELRDPGGRQGPGQDLPVLPMEMRHQQQAGDQEQVQQNRRRRRGGEAIDRIQ